jgi:4-hydroxy-tetrahydrodipicolinate synthase
MARCAAEGVVVPLVTPSNLDDFEPLIDHVLAGGVKDLVLFGTTGEGDKIDLATKKSAICAVAPFVGERARLHVGLLCPTAEEAIYLADFCHELGFESALLPPHLYGDDSATVVLDFLANSSSRFMLYNPPGAAPLGTMVYSFDSNRVVGLKDSSGDLELLHDLVNLSSASPCKIFYGREHQLDKALELDINGIVPGTGNVQPELFVQLWQQKDHELLAQLSLLKQRVKSYCPSSYVEGLKLSLMELGVIRG